jgi:hypothetical protein
VGEQQQQAGNYREYRVTEQVNGMAHFFTISLDHRLQFLDFFGRLLSLDKAVQAINDRQHPENEVDTDVHIQAMVTQPGTEQ